MPALLAGSRRHSAGRLPRLAALALLAFVAPATPAVAAPAVTKAEATAKALAALGVNDRTSPEIVFVAPDPIDKGTEVRIGGPKKFAGTKTNGDGVATIPARTAIKAGARSWLFYDDRAPGLGFERDGRVALVSTVDGKVTVTDDLRWPPLLGDKPPVFLRSPGAYDAAGYRVFSRGARTARRAADNDLLLSSDELDGKPVVSVLDAKSCFIQIGSTLTGGVFGSDGSGQTATLVEAFGVRMSVFRKSIGTARYAARSQGTPQDWLKSKLKNCKDAFVWLGGAGYTPTDALLLGSAGAGSKLRIKDFTGNDLFQVAKARRTTRITVMIDAPNRDQFIPTLKKAQNIRLLPVPVGGVPGSRNKGDSLLTYTRRLLVGWGRQSKSLPTDRYGSAPECEAGMPFFFSRAVDPTACTAPPAPVIPTPPPVALAIPTTDLTLGISTTSPSPELGGIVPLTVSLTNVGPEATTSTAVKLKLPAGITILPPAPGDFDAATSVWTVGPVAAGAVRVLQLQTTVGAVAPATVTAEVLSAFPPDPDSTPNNGAAGEDDQASVTITPRAADLELTATPSAGAWASSSARDITITLMNKGPDEALTNTVQIELPAGVDYDASTLTGGSYNSGSGLWSVPSLGVNQSVTLKLFVNVLTSGTKTIPIALIGAGRGDPDSAPANGPGEDDNATLAIPVS